MGRNVTITLSAEGYTVFKQLPHGWKSRILDTLLLRWHRDGGMKELKSQGYVSSRRSSTPSLRKTTKPPLSIKRLIQPGDEDA